jgi:hypothetical protein
MGQSFYGISRSSRITGKQIVMLPFVQRIFQRVTSSHQIQPCFFQPLLPKASHHDLKRENLIH